MKFGNLILFRPGPGESPPISPEALAGWVATSRYVKIHLDVWSSFADRMTRDERARAAIIVHLAERLYEREHGKPPASVDALVGPYLKAIPAGYVTPNETPDRPGPPR